MAIDDEEIFPAVVVDINEAGAKADILSAQRGNASRAGLIAEDFFAEVLVKGVEFILEVGDEEGRASRSVEITGVHSHAAVVIPDFIAGDTGVGAFFFELAAAIEVEMVFRSIVGNVDIRSAVAVQVGQNHAEATAVAAQVVVFGHIAKGAVPIIAIESVSERLETLRRTEIALVAGAGVLADG